MGRLPLVEAELAAGQLVAVLGPPRLCATGYWLVTEGQSRTRPEVAAFRNWIRRELGDAPDLPDGPVPRRGQLARMSRMSA
jgi:LysR family transcriptional regulator, glycine cleavage system transcriptional activator